LPHVGKSGKGVEGMRGIAGLGVCECNGFDRIGRVIEERLYLESCLNIAEFVAGVTCCVSLAAKIGKLFAGARQ